MSKSSMILREIGFEVNAKTCERSPRGTATDRSITSCHIYDSLREVRHAFGTNSQEGKAGPEPTAGNEIA